MASRRSLFDLWEMARQLDLYTSLGALPPGRTWSIMTEIRDAELAVFEQEDLAAYASQARLSLELAPAVAGVWDVERVAADFARYMCTRYFDCVFLGIYAKAIGSDRALLSAFGTTRDRRHLDDALAGGGAILLPLHMGPYPCILPLVAAEMPVTTLLQASAEADFGRIVTQYLPSIDLEMIGMPDRRILLRCLQAIRAGRLLVMFPEFSWGIDQPKLRLPLLGATVEAPSGAAVLAQRTGRRLVPCTIGRDGPGHYELRYHPPIGVEPGDAGIRDAVTAVFSVVTDEVMRRPGEWQGWDFFDVMVASDRPPVPLSERVRDR